MKGWGSTDLKTSGMARSIAITVFSERSSQSYSWPGISTLMKVKGFCITLPVVRIGLLELVLA